MLAYILSILTGLGSLAVYLAAFFFPAIHRQSDFIWSGVGLFYALALWVYAAQETGGLLLSQIAAVALLGWFGWQTLSLRLQVDSQETVRQTLRLQELDRQATQKDAQPLQTSQAATEPGQVKLVGDDRTTAAFELPESPDLLDCEFDSEAQAADPWDAEPVQPQPSVPPPEA
ncbi:Ycf66 family protein [Leptolyngbya sp. FACHB-261]|uniref:Ycf66 family protein n=1 Tax=Leptolyngbya sp. FACHB-261 TaxID=2692806 RepID=UPI001681D910|nr:Ycf66 family protein [Leptolyngbya sp. FACHB-261]MBD2099537.1 Ycf66 family protein [Leptolyngbya sp. FACHB-261]